MSSVGLLSRELQVFEEHRQEWWGLHPTAYVAIQDEVIVEGFFETYAEAFKAGLRRFGVGRAFLVKQIWVPEPVYSVS